MKEAKRLKIQLMVRPLQQRSKTTKKDRKLYDVAYYNAQKKKLSAPKQAK